VTRILIVALLVAAGSAQASDFWSSLWRNADQRGERLLRQGDAAAAARAYADPRRRAYAELLAGDHAAAARDFAAFDDGDAHYNRGNALALGGDLDAALKAYDTALARDPGNVDARRNRELVARALRQTPPRQQPPEKNRGGTSAARAPGDTNGSASRQAAADKSPSAGDRKTGEGGRPEAGDATDALGQHGAGPRQEAGDDATQARRDAEAGLNGDKPEGRPQPGWVEVPRNEQQLAREQWLRQIPDDPGGLLRRKFMIEHLMRQQGKTR